MDETAAVGVGGAILVLLATLAGISLYVVPGIVASTRGHRQVMAIWVLNILAGWTFIGWVGALVWALTTDKK